jgi:hypothetical protein
MKVKHCDACGEEIVRGWNASSITETVEFTDIKSKRVRKITYCLSMFNFIKPDLCGTCFRRHVIGIATTGFISKY